MDSAFPKDEDEEKVMLAALLHPKAQKELDGIPAKFRKHILEQLHILEKYDHPLQHPRVIKLQGGDGHDYRLRVGNYRVKFTLRRSDVLVTHVHDRKVGY